MCKINQILDQLIMAVIYAKAERETTTAMTETAGVKFRHLGPGIYH